MERYRVNYGLLIGLVVGVIALGGGAFGLYKFQQSRNAGRFIEEANKAEEENDLRGVRDNLARYLRLRRDDMDNYERYTRARLDISELPDAEPSEINDGYAALEQFVQLQPEHDEFRRQLVDLLITRGRFKDALTHLNYLLNQDPKNGELQGMRLQCMTRNNKVSEAIKIGFQLVGYDSAKDEFDSEKAITPDAATVHLILANSIRGNRGDPELADRVMDTLIENNPESSDAFVSRGRYLAGTARVEDGRADIDKALELSSTNVEGLLLKAQLLIGTPQEDTEARKLQLDEAYDLLERAAAADSEDARVYQYLADLELQRGSPEAAITQYDRGIKSVSDRSSLQLAFYKAKTQINHGELEGAEATIEELVAMQLRPEFIDYLKSLVAYKNSEWFKAAEGLERVRPSIKDYKLFSELNVTLAICRERLGQYERAIEAYGQILEKNPNERFSLAATRRLQARLRPQTSSESNSQAGINVLIDRELEKDRADQDLNKIWKKIAEYTSQPLVPPGMENLLRAEVYVRLKEYDLAQKEVTKAVRESPDDLRVWRAALRVIASNPTKGPIEALAKTKKVVDEFGDLPVIRLDMADFYIMIADEDVANQLLKLTEGTESWERDQQVQLWKGIALRMQQLGENELRLQAMEKVAELSPNELPTLLTLFQTAIESNDEEKIDAAQKRIFDLVGSKKNATYLLTEANRLLWRFSSGNDGKEVLDQADRLIEQALLERPDWHRLYQMQGLVALGRQDRPAALEAFKQCAARGPLDTRALLLHVSLLMEQRRYNDAKTALEQLNASVRQRLLGRNYADILLNTGEVGPALKCADEVAQLRSEDGPTQLWYGRFLVRASLSRELSGERKKECREQAEVALRKSIDLTPTNTEAWMSLVGLMVDNRDSAAAEDVLREAMLALPEDQQPGLVARGYEMVGRWFDAETAYRQIFERSSGSINAAQALAAFYLSPRYPNNDRGLKATPLLNKILRAAAEDDSEEKKVAKSAVVLWARRTSAELLSKTNDYQKLLDAERLLSSNAVGDQMAAADRLLMARILGSRPEPTSRVKAIRLLEGLQRLQPLSLRDDLLLGQLYYATDNWEACRAQMAETIARNPQAGAARVSYINMLLNRSDLIEASRQLTRLKQQAPQAPATLQLIVRVANRMGKQAEARQALAKLAPRDLTKANVEQLLQLARLFTELEDYDRAEVLFRAAAKQAPGAKIYLADFLGIHRDVGQAFELLDAASKEVKLPVLCSTATGILRARRDEIGDKYDEQLEKLLTRGLRNDPLSIPLNMRKAEFRDLQGRRDETAVIYRDLLKLTSLTGTNRAIVLNNLGYLLGQLAEDQATAEEAMGYVAEAVDLLGPQADILDTRAVVHTALKQYNAAIADLELSLIDNPTASKHFHKALAHMLSGDDESAAESLKEANTLGLTRDSLPEVERADFDKLIEKIGELAS